MRQNIIIIVVLFIIHSSVYGAEPYRFRSGDYIDLYVYNTEELCGEFRIFSDGYVRLPLVGKVLMIGMTEEEAYESLRSAIGKYIINPNFTLSPKYSVSVMGYVTRPGVFTITDSDRIIELIALAGGYTDDASGSITIFREDQKINISRNTILEKDSALGYAQPGDVIYAQRKLITRNDFSLILSSVSAMLAAIYYFKIW